MTNTLPSAGLPIGSYTLVYDSDARPTVTLDAPGRTGP